jgi:uncharacterized membrane protein
VAAAPPESVQEAPHPDEEHHVIILGVILLLIGLIAGISILTIIGLVLIVVGIILFLVPIGGVRRRYY